MDTLVNDFRDWDLKGKYKIEKEIGAGSYGSVVRARHAVTGQVVAVKRVTNLFDDLVDGKRTLRELALLKRLKHPNIVNLIEVFVPNDDFANFTEISMVLECAPSDLKKVFKSKAHLSLESIVLITYNMLVGLKYIHSAGVWHRDLKPANVLMFDNGQAKLCDFGLARSVETAPVLTESKTIENADTLPRGRPVLKKASKLKSNLTSHVVTRWYRAPEVILVEKNYNQKIDVWSLGCIFTELLLMMKEHTDSPLERKPFFPGHSCFPLSPDSNAKLQKSGFPVDSADQLIMILKKMGTPNSGDLDFITDEKALAYLKSMPQYPKSNLSKIFHAASAEAISFIEGCLTFNPHKRLSIDECLAHPLFASIRNPSVEKIEQHKLIFEFESDEIRTVKQLRELFAKEIKS